MRLMHSFDDPMLICYLLQKSSMCNVHSTQEKIIRVFTLRKPAATKVTLETLQAFPAIVIGKIHLLEVRCYGGDDPGVRIAV